MSTFYDENGNEKETMQSEETENLRKRKRKKKAKLRKIKRKVKKLKNSVFGDLELLSKQDRRKMKKYKNQKKAILLRGNLPITKVNSLTMKHGFQGQRTVFLELFR